MQTEKKLVKKIQRKGDCPVVGQYTGLVQDKVNDLVEKEGKMHAEDKLVMETEVSVPYVLYFLF